MEINNELAVDYGANTYYTTVEKNGEVFASTLYRNGKIILYEETKKIIKTLKDYGDFEFTKVIKRIRFDEQGRLIPRL